MKSVLLLPVLLSTSSAYFAQVNNAHVEFVAAEQTNHDSTAETVDDRSSLQHSPTSLWTALESALEEKSELGYAAPKIMSLFDDWVEEFGREYRDVEEKSKRLLVWLENHGKPNLLYTCLMCGVTITSIFCNVLLLFIGTNDDFCNSSYTFDIF